MAEATATTTTATATPPPATGAEAGAWMMGFNEEQKAFVQNKGYKGPGDVVDSYRNAEKLIGMPAERVLKLPEKMDSPEMRAIWERLGAPKEAKEYGIEVPKEGGDAKLMETFIGTFHENGVTKTAAQKIVSKWNEFQAARATEMKAQADLNFKNQDAALKKEWGAAYEQNMNLAKQAAGVVGLNAQQVDALASQIGHDGVGKLLHKISLSTRESGFVAGANPGTGLMTPEQAKTAIKGLMTDLDFQRRFAAGETEAKAKWQSLHVMAHPGEYNF